MVTNFVLENTSLKCAAKFCFQWYPDLFRGLTMAHICLASESLEHLVSPRIFTGPGIVIFSCMGPKALKIKGNDQAVLFAAMYHPPQCFQKASSWIFFTSHDICKIPADLWSAAIHLAWHPIWSIRGLWHPIITTNSIVGKEVSWWRNGGSESLSESVQIPQGDSVVEWRLIPSLADSVSDCH